MIILDLNLPLDLDFTTRPYKLSYHLAAESNTSNSITFPQTSDASLPHNYDLLFSLIPPTM